MNNVDKRILKQDAQNQERDAIYYKQKYEEAVEYKFFDNVDDFGDFMTQYNDKIIKLQILEGYEKSDDFMLEDGDIQILQEDN